MRVEIERSRGQIGTGRWKAAQQIGVIMGETKKLTTEEKQALLLDTQLETALLTRDRTQKENAVYVETEEDRARKRESVQMLARANAEAQTRRELKCKHNAGVKFNNLNGKGVFGSCLTASKIFFSWNWLIQCVWCGLKNQTPHPMRKSTKPQEVKVKVIVNGRSLWRMETAEEVKARVALYEKDMERHHALLEDALGSGLTPMEGPQFQFSDSDGMPVIPEVR
jgi:hypothetical protein